MFLVAPRLSAIAATLLLIYCPSRAFLLYVQSACNFTAAAGAGDRIESRKGGDGTAVAKETKAKFEKVQQQTLEGKEEEDNLLDLFSTFGQEEQMLADVVEEHVRQHGGPQELVEQLEEALDEDAEVLVRKFWRIVIFLSESEKKGLST